MGTYKFIYEASEPGMPSAAVVFNDRDREYAHITNVLDAFRQFLLGVTFQRETIAKYIDVEKVNRELADNL